MSKFNFLVENMLVDLKEGRIPKSAQFSNIEIDASAFADKLNAGDMNELIEAWSTKKWLGGLPQDKIREILNNLAADLTEYPPRSYTELWAQIETQVREGVPTRKDLVQKMTRVTANLLTDPSFGLIKTVEAPAETKGSSRTETLEDEEELSEVAEKALEYVRQAEEPSEYADVVKYITGSFAKEESEAEAIVKELISKNLIEKQGDTLVPKEETGAAILDTDEEPISTGDAKHDKELRRAAALEYDPDVEAAYKEYLSSDYSSDNYSYGD
jgi:hypothetical protein